MTSFVYDAAVDGMAKGEIAFAVDSFRVLLVSGAYIPNKATHAKRSDVIGEVSGTGYTAGGKAIGVVVVTDLTENRTDISLDGADWPGSTITARGAVYYDNRGGAATDDELIAYIDFNSNVVSISGLFALQPSTVRISNP